MLLISTEFKVVLNAINNTDSASINTCKMKTCTPYKLRSIQHSQNRIRFEFHVLEQPRKKFRFHTHDQISFSSIISLKHMQFRGDEDYQRSSTCRTLNVFFSPTIALECFQHLAQLCDTVKTRRKLIISWKKQTPHDATPPDDLSQFHHPVFDGIGCPQALTTDRTWARKYPEVTRSMTTNHTHVSISDLHWKIKLRKRIWTCREGR